MYALSSTVAVALSPVGLGTAAPALGSYPMEATLS